MGNKVESILRGGLGWEKAEAKIIDRVFVMKDDDPQSGTAPTRIDDYMIELAAPNGGTVKLVIRERRSKLDGVNKGGIVPVLVNRKRSKATFDFTDPRLDPNAVSDGERAAREAAANREWERFDEKLKGD